MKTRYLLHGGHTRIPNELNSKFFKELQRDVPDGGSVLLVYQAHQPEKFQEIYNKQVEVLKENSGGKTLHYAIATKQDFLEQVRHASAIYMHGGDTHLLLDFLKQFPEFPQLIKGKTVGGSSAGAYVLATWAFNNDTQELIEGLGVLPIKIHAHHAGQEEVVNILRALPEQLELVLIPDYETREFVVEG